MDKHDGDDAPKGPEPVPVSKDRPRDMFWTLDNALRHQDQADEPIQVTPDGMVEIPPSVQRCPSCRRPMTSPSEGRIGCEACDGSLSIEEWEQRKRREMAAEVNALAARIAKGELAIKALKDIKKADDLAGWLPPHIRAKIGAALEA